MRQITGVYLKIDPELTTVVNIVAVTSYSKYVPAACVRRTTPLEQATMRAVSNQHITLADSKKLHHMLFGKYFAKGVISSAAEFRN